MNIKESYITEEELTKERTPIELFNWVIDRFKQIGTTEEGEKALLLEEGLLKQLREEVYPLAIFGSRKYGDNDKIYLKPIIGNQNYDAIVTNKSKDPPIQEYLEITQAHEGEKEYLRRLFIMQHGYAFFHSPINKIGTKKTGLQITNPVKAVTADEVARSEITLIIEAAKRKELKNYPSDTALIIFFEDDLFFRKAINNTILDSIMRGSLLNLKLAFSYIYLVGREEIFREYKLMIDKP